MTKLRLAVAVLFVKKKQHKTIIQIIYADLWKVDYFKLNSFKSQELAYKEWLLFASYFLFAFFNS